MIITNFKNLARNPLRKKALLIAEAGYGAIEISKVVSERIKIDGEILKVFTSNSAGLIYKTKPSARLNLKNFRRIFIIGVGKGSAMASATLAGILGGRLAGGIALDIQKFKIQNSKFKILVGTHPLPSKQNIKATQKIIKLVKNLNKDDLLITFICGGGSALLCGSEKELKYSVLATKLLTKAGADIKELNIIRKHLSEIKGGGLAKLAYPATVVSLIVSDVPTANNDLSMVASGPTVYDKTTKKDAEKILKKYKLQTTGYRLQIIETPKDKKYFKKAKNILFLSNREPVSAMAEKAEKLGMKPKIYSLKLKGEAGNALIGLTLSVRSNEAVIAGGETTVKFKVQSSKLKVEESDKPFGAAQGKGGRNMEAVLGTLTKLIQNSEFRIQNYALLSVASDGHDNTEAAGAIADALTIQKAKKLKLNPQKFLNNHDSFNFFAKTGDLIYTNKKSFNVADLMLVLSALKE